MNDKFDVFLCHNSEDKAAVKKIGEQLKDDGLRPWLDEWELRPGLPWQPALEQKIENIGAAAVFVGTSGIGPWQQMELDAYLRQFVKRECPVIPVILQGSSEIPKLPPFLHGMTWVNFRQAEPDPLGQLIWGITGNKRSRVIPAAANGMDEAGEYVYEDDWVVQTIDHMMQRATVADHFEASAADKPDRAYFYFEATPDDCPLALADHTYIEIARYAPETDSFATELYRNGHGSHAIWRALLHKVPGGRDQSSKQDAQQLVHDWINSRRLTVLYAVIDAEQEGKYLPQMMQGACADLDALPPFANGVHLKLFFACLKAQEKRSLLQRISRWRSAPKLTNRCCILDSLKALNRVDIDYWLSGFTPQQERRYHKERLRSELGALLRLQDQPYAIVRDHLTNGGALYGARRQSI